MGDFAFFNCDDLKNFTFYKFPKALFSDPQYRDISDSAKILYMIFYDRLTLSLENKFYDENGLVYINYSIESVMEELGWSKNKVKRALTCLEDNQMIMRSRPKANRAYRIYVTKLDKKPVEEGVQNGPVGGPKRTRRGSQTDPHNKTKYNKTKYIDIYSACARVTQTKQKSKKNNSILLKRENKNRIRASGDSS